MTNARANLLLDARMTVVKLESKMMAAEYLRTLDLRLRQSKAALTIERAASVVERQKLHDHVVPMVQACRIRDSQNSAAERRANAMTRVAEKAHGFVRRVVMTCAAAEMKARVQAEAARVNMEDRLAAAAERKEELLARDVTAMAGGGPASPSPERTTSAKRAQRPRPLTALAGDYPGARRRLSESPFGVSGTTVYRPPSPDSPYLYKEIENDESRSRARSRSSRGGMKRSRHSIAGGEASCSVPSSPVGA